MKRSYLKGNVVSFFSVFTIFAIILSCGEKKQQVSHKVETPVFGIEYTIIEKEDDTLCKNKELIDEVKNVEISNDKKAIITVFNYDKLHIELKGFVNSNQRILVSNLAPLFSKVLVADMDSDGLNEIFIVHECIGTSREQDIIIGFTYKNNEYKIIDTRYFGIMCGGNGGCEIYFDDNILINSYNTGDKFTGPLMQVNEFLDISNYNDKYVLFVTKTESYDTPGGG